MLTCAGKTILASTIIDSCLADQLSSTSFFYCKDTDPERNDSLSIFKGILSQLLHNHRDLLPHCHEKRLASGELNLTSTSLAQQLIELSIQNLIFVQNISKLNVVIDGLDECNMIERKSIMSFLVALVEKCDERDPGRLRVLFVSQDYPDISKLFVTTAVMSLTATDIGNDLAQYVRKWSREIQKKHNLTESQQESLVVSTLAGAGGIRESLRYLDPALMSDTGMFLFAKLVMANLHGQPTKIDLLNELGPSIFPQGLAQA